jgi:Immunity protein 21
MTNSGAEMAPTRHHWISTTGGPHLLLPEELLPYWRGIDGWNDHRDPSDKSDYARACRVNSWLGLIPCHTGQALVLSGDVGMIAWIPNAHQEGGMLVQWIAVDDEANIVDAAWQPGTRKRA